jgi:formate dehydrogenase subunit gamma
MAKLTAHLRTVAGALALAFVLALAGALTSPPTSAQINQSNAVNEQQLLGQLKAIQGRGSIPDTKSYVIEHPAGRDWRQFRSSTLLWVGAIAILGIIVLLAIFYLWRGRIPIEEGRSGRLVLRFTWFERLVHWTTATSFVVLAITGLNVTFGRPLFVGNGGSEAFSTWSQWAKYAHNYISFAFTLGVLLMFLMWIGQNFPTRADVVWLKHGGGNFTKPHGGHPPAWKFNAGQKILYWIVVLSGIAMMVTGYMLMFPFYGGLTVANMELAQIFHGIVGVLYIALIIGHIYIGTLGMEGAFEAMGEGTVDYNWAKEHHPLWAEEEMRRRPESTTGTRPLVTPAE